MKNILMCLLQGYFGFDPDNAIGRGHGFHRQQGGQGVEQGIRVMHIQVA